MVKIKNPKFLISNKKAFYYTLNNLKFKDLNHCDSTRVRWTHGGHKPNLSIRDRHFFSN